MTDEPLARLDELESRVRELEVEVSRLRSGTPGPAAVSSLQPPPPSPGARWVPPAAGPPSPPAMATTPGARPGLVLESESILKWGGVALVVLSVGFAVSTAISRGWIGPELQLAGAVALSLALIVVGVRLRPTRLPWTHALCSGGVAALFTTFASDLFLEQANTDVAFGATVAIGIAGYGLARAVSSEWVGVTTFVGGLTAWLVIGVDELAFHPSLGWFAALVGVAVVLSLDRRWFGLRLLAHAAGLLILLGLADEAELGSEQVVVAIAAAALFLSLARIPSIGELDSVFQELEIQLVAVAGPWLYAVVAIVLDLDADLDLGETALSVAVVTGLVAMAMRPQIHAAHFVSLLIGASVSLTLALAFLLSVTLAFVAVAVQGLGLIALSRALGDRLRVLLNAAALLLAVGVYVLAVTVAAWTEDVAIGEDIAALVIIVILAVAVWAGRDETTRQFGAAAILGLALIWLGSVLVHLPEGQAAVSVSWAVVGIAVLVTGAIRKLPDVGGAGLAVLALTVGKLLIVDMQEVDTLWRAALFFVVGLGLMRLGFMLPRLTGASDEEPVSAGAP